MSLYGPDEGIPVELTAGETLDPACMALRVVAIHKDRVVLMMTRTTTRIIEGDCPYCGAKITNGAPPK